MNESVENRAATASHTFETSTTSDKSNVDTLDVPKCQKTFVPLENSPEVMTALAHELGLSPELVFHDVYSIDEPELLAFIPRPASALLLVFPISKAYEEFRIKEDQNIAEYSGKGSEEPVVWYRQTIRNACGLMGILHAISNGSSRKFIEPGSSIDSLLKEAIPLGPSDRASLIYHSKDLENANQNAAGGGQSIVANPDDNIDLHFVCFIKDNNHNLWELDGRRKGPINRGTLSSDEDILSEKALNLGVKTFIKRQKASGQDLRFSLIALAPN